jgi:hypothetical protein
MGPGLHAGAGWAIFMNALSKEEELSLLRQQSEWLPGRIEAIGKRIQELEQEEEWALEVHADEDSSLVYRAGH